MIELNNALFTGAIASIRHVTPSLAALFIEAITLRNKWCKLRAF